jgi:hypothetical protein
MKTKLISLFISLIFLLNACTKETTIPNTPEDTLYSNSFENGTELKNFEGIEFFLSSDTPAGGGDSSIVVSGGCVAPHLYFDLGPFDEVQNLSFNIYGKAQDMIGGAVFLRLANDPETNISITVQDTNWAFYATQNILEVPVGEKVRVEFQSGGFVPVTTFFDLLKIESE